MARVSFDSSVMQAVADHRTAWATAVAKATTTVGTTPAVLVAACWSRPWSWWWSFGPTALRSLPCWRC